MSLEIITRRGDASHDDLMDISSRFAYADLSSTIKNRKSLDINGKEFRVLDAVHDSNTGLDAYTFQSVRTGELIVGFVGTAGTADVITDALLVTSATPAQYRAAEAYVRQVESRYERPVGSVCGNSLGGGLAAYVAARNTNIEAVTVNPAPVPAELAGSDAPNVHNYITSTDILHRAVVAGGMQSRIIGDTTMIKGTSYNLAFVTENHVGSDRGDVRETPYDASMSVPFSLFDHNQVVREGDFGAKIHITPESLDEIVSGLARRRTELLAVLSAELRRTEDDLRVHAAGIEQREEELRQAFLDRVDRLCGLIKERVRDVRAQVWNFEERFRRLVPPGPLLGVWDGPAGLILGKLEELLRALEELAHATVRDIADRVWCANRYLILDGSLEITNGLLGQSRGLQADMDLIDEKWLTVSAFVGVVRQVVADADQSVADAIADGTCPADAVPVASPLWPAGKVDVLRDRWSKQLWQTVIDARQVAAGSFVKSFALEFATPLSLLAGVATVAILALEGAQIAVGAAVHTIRTAVILPALSPLALVTGVSNDLWKFRTDLGHVHSDFCTMSNLWKEMLSAVRRVLTHLPDVIEELSPQLESTFFSDATIEMAINSYLKCRNLVECSQMAFAEIAAHLKDHQASAIDVIGERAENVKCDLATASRNLTEMVR